MLDTPTIPANYSTEVSGASTLQNATVYIVDDEHSSRELIEAFARSAGYQTQVFESAVDFLERFQNEPGTPRCLISDMCMPEIDGLALQQRLAQRDIALPMIFVSAVAGVPDAVSAIKYGALDFLTKPIDRERLLTCIRHALAKDQEASAASMRAAAIQQRLNRLTQREREVMELLVKARSTKEIASDLNINAKTVFVHRARVMEKMGVESLVELSRMMSSAAT